MGEIGCTGECERLERRVFVNGTQVNVAKSIVHDRAFDGFMYGV